MREWIIALLVLAMAGCTAGRGFDRGTLRSEISEQKVVTEDDIKRALAAKPQLPRPFKLAVYLAPPRGVNGPFDKWSKDSWKWLEEDKQRLLQLGTELKAKGIVSEVFLLSDAILEGSDNKALRLGAARAGADAVLVVKGISDVETSINAWFVTYVLLLPMYFAPAFDLNSIFLVNASLWDVGNQFLYLSVETEGTGSVAQPATLMDRPDRAIKAAKSNAIAAMVKDLATRLASMDVK